MFFFMAILFFVLTPGILVTLPPKCSKMTVAMTHAVLFAFIWSVIHKPVWNWGMSNQWMLKTHKEGMTLRQCNEKNGKYKDGNCYDTNGKAI